MKNFNWEEFKKGNIEVRCRTEELAKDFLTQCDNHGIKWGGGQSIIPFDNYWDEYKEEMVYGIWRSKDRYLYTPHKIGGLYYGNTLEDEKEFVEWNIEDSCGVKKEVFSEEELKLCEGTNTKVQILKDEVGEYLDLELVRYDHKFNFQFYLNNIYVKNKDEVINQSNGFTRVMYVPGQDIVFELKKAESYPLKKKMTKEEIEKELGYKIEIVED